jgi:photosystem II stability/assembly factor-like uncharacterized protein
MKKALLTFTILLPFFADAQWNLVYNHGDTETGLHVVSKDTVIAITESGGRIHRTINAGQSWNFYQTIFTTSWFLDVHFPSKSVGYACGGTAFGTHRNVIAKTTNGGLTWDSLTSNDYTGYSFTNIRFADNNKGLVSGEAGLLLRTTDGGNSFSQVTLPHPGNVTAICIQSAFNTLIATDQYLTSDKHVYRIYMTPNLGTSCLLLYTDTMTGVTGLNHRMINKIQFLDPNKGFAVGGNGLFLSTTNASTWSRSFIAPFTDLTAVHYTSPQTGYINNSGGIYRSVPGAPWSAQSITPATTISHIMFANDSVGYAIGANGIYKSKQLVTGISEVVTNPGAFYPNPAENVLYLGAEWRQIKNVQVISASNKLCISKHGPAESLDLSGLPAGVYFITVFTSETTRTGKFVKE